MAFAVMHAFEDVATLGGGAAESAEKNIPNCMVAKTVVDDNRRQATLGLKQAEN